LIAESTGKKGVAIVPVDGERIEPASKYRADRVFVSLSLNGAKTSNERYQRLQELERSGHPFISIELNSTYDLAQEFFRWEFATAVAGSVMGINPFNQPDVEAAKVEARKITEEYEKTGALPTEEPFAEFDGLNFFASANYARTLTSANERKTLAGFLTAHLREIESGDYFALLAYVKMNAGNEKLLQTIRTKVLEKYRCATCLGFGPRFLHSTGQAYKGGGNNGVFLQITSDDEFDLPVPGQKYTFGVVKAAQARGDFQVLLDRGRRALRVHLGADVKKGLEKILTLV
jgi:transaldolase/glucose-6-phosphate isomerase